MTGKRQVRVAIAGDLHVDGVARGSLRELFDSVAREADVLALVGDLTTHGEPEHFRGFVQEMEGFDVPVVTVLGNHATRRRRRARGSASCRIVASTSSTATTS